MGIGPQGPLRKDDGPACRVCGCTEHNACLIDIGVGYSKSQRRSVNMRVGCSWVKVEGATDPLCSACSGTAADLNEAMGRVRRMMLQQGARGVDFSVKIAIHARLRYRARLKLST